MDDRPPQREDWISTQEELDKLLEHLDPDRDRAAEKYEQIRKRVELARAMINELSGVEPEKAPHMTAGKAAWFDSV